MDIDTPMAGSVFAIVLTWNNVQDTVECLESLRGVQYPRLQVVCVDNGSTDDTVTIVRTKFPQVCVIENGRNLGYAEGNNVGIRYALERGAEYILILNNDTTVDSQILQELVSVGETRTDAGVLAPQIYFSGEPTRLWFAGGKWNPRRYLYDYLHWGKDDRDLALDPLETEIASGCAMLIRASTIKEVGLFDPRFFLTWEETDWCCRLRQHGYKILAIPRAKVWHKVSKSFRDGNEGGDYAYYYMRNWLLFARRNLTLSDQLGVGRRTFRILRGYGAALRGTDHTDLKRITQRARLLGTCHFMLGHFGALSERDRAWMKR